ncbi:S9 family peptidase [Coralloluteibacterium thermophilus]|uniref:S9 family peptidase n=1 Tax=Coralloluteibacterium thermophilum TaxID=2707049 RepID=A0ABV9NE40_9GAMM
MRVTVSLLSLALLASPLVAQETMTVEQAMADPDWIGPPVERAWWAWDSANVHYTLKREGSNLRDTWTQAIDAERGEVVDDAGLAAIDAARPVYDRGRTRMAYVRNGDVFLRDLRNGVLVQVWRGTSAADGLRFDADGAGLIWRVGNTWYGWRPNGTAGVLAELKAEKDPAADPAPDAMRDMQLRLIATLAKRKAERDAQREQADAQRAADPTRVPRPVYLGEKTVAAEHALSPAGRWLLMATGPDPREGGGRTGRMPKYVTESGYEEFEDVRVRVGRDAPRGHALKLVDLASGEASELELGILPGITTDPLADLRKAAGKPPLEGRRVVRVDRIVWNDAGTRAAVMLRAVDNKDRWIATVDTANGRLQPLHRLTDDAWINWSFNDLGWLPDNETVWFLSEESGYSHLYTQRPGQNARQLTRGEWEVSSPVLAADGRSWLFKCNQAWPGDYEVCQAGVDGGEVRELTALDGVEDFVQSPDGNQLLVRWSSSYVPPQLAVLPATGGEARRLTDTRTPEYAARSFVQPEFVQVPSKHGAGTIWGKFYRPADMEPGRRYPIVLFVHGAGYLQNVHAGYPNYFREQLFHNALVDAGYIVLDLDFRASAGYGRDWRTAIYRQMGHPELEDYLDGIDWLVENHQGDRDRVGIYGGSYGGFMTFMAMFREPERFHAGAALRPVTDWTQYNHQYTSNILNTPDLDPEAYRRSSPIELAEGLQGHLLIAHGMMDDNVFYQDSVRLAQRLIELRKDNWELASYPLERHGYVEPDAWFDQYRRIFKLFERALKE